MSDNTVNIWRGFMRAQSLSERTIEERVFTVLRMSVKCGDVLTVSAPELAGWLGDLDISPTSRATYYGHLAAFFSWATSLDLRTENPMVKVPKTRRPKCIPRPVTTEAVDAIISVANRRKTRMMVLLAAFAGLRVHEIAKLRGEDVDLDTESMYVEGKGGSRAMIPIHARILKAAEDFPRVGFWFTGQAAAHVSSRAVSSCIRGCFRRAGYDATAHQLRHWYGTTLLATGTDIRVVQELMRHQSIQSTTIYTQVNDEMRRRAIKSLVA